MYVPCRCQSESKQPFNVLSLVVSLVGEVAGKAPLGIAKKEEVNVNLTHMRGKVDSATGVVSETRMVRWTADGRKSSGIVSLQKLIERGQKLSEVELASKQMSDTAEEFASLTHKLMVKNREKAERGWLFPSKK